MLPLLELAVESSDVTIPSVSSCLSACAWLAMLPKTTGRAWSLLQTSFSLPETGPRAQLSYANFCCPLQSVESGRCMGGPVTGSSDVECILGQ